ncbi:MAG TPA: SsrA-binding protein SmpB [Candidatus Saccharimonadales bacterium]|jgi:SsrA-binding protein|nr:SsrA-binding protein SmpB [Candidatus Saccharimonadales bacterium]
MKIFNKKARFEYELSGEGVEAGISLLGAEAKSVREGRADISQAAVRVLGNEMYLINANIPATGIQKYDSTRMRKLLLHRGEILSLVTKMKQKRLQIVPVRVYNKGRLIKLYLELGKGKKKYEKKESIKRHDINRDIQAALKNTA